MRNFWLFILIVSFFSGSSYARVELTLNDTVHTWDNLDAITWTQSEEFVVGNERFSYRFGDLKILATGGVYLEHDLVVTGNLELFTDYVSFDYAKLAVVGNQDDFLLINSSGNFLMEGIGELLISNNIFIEIKNNFDIDLIPEDAFNPATVVPITDSNNGGDVVISGGGGGLTIGTDDSSSGGDSLTIEAGSSGQDENESDSENTTTQPETDDESNQQQQTVEYSYERIKAEILVDVFNEFLGDPELLDKGWVNSSWLNFLNLGHYPWSYHNQHGWMYGKLGEDDSVWLWMENMGWCWTAKSIYPWIYRHQDGVWLYAYGEGASMWYYNQETKVWEHN